MSTDSDHPDTTRFHSTRVAKKTPPSSEELDAVIAAMVASNREDLAKDGADKRSEDADQPTEDGDPATEASIAAAERDSAPARQRSRGKKPGLIRRLGRVFETPRPSEAPLPDPAVAEAIAVPEPEPVADAKPENVQEPAIVVADDPWDPEAEPAVEASIDAQAEALFGADAAPESADEPAAESGTPRAPEPIEAKQEAASPAADAREPAPANDDMWDDDDWSWLETENDTQTDSDEMDWPDPPAQDAAEVEPEATAPPAELRDEKTGRDEVLGAIAAVVADATLPEPKPARGKDGATPATDAPAPAAPKRRFWHRSKAAPEAKARPEPAAQHEAGSDTGRDTGLRAVLRAAPILLPIPVLALGVIAGGRFSLLALFVMLLVSVSPRDLYQRGSDPLPSGAPSVFSGTGLATVLGVAHFALLALGLFALGGGTGLSFLAWIGILLSLALYFGQVSALAAHDLIHSRNRRLFALGAWVHVSMLYGHHVSAHRRIHHPYVATQNDPATPEPGDGFWDYAPLAWWRSFVAGYEMETAAMRPRLGARRRRIHPYYIWLGGAVVLILATAILFGFGAMLAYVILLCPLVQVQFLMADFVDHYGLKRSMLNDGKLEPAGAQHSWVAPAVLPRAFRPRAAHRGDHDLRGVGSRRRSGRARADPALADAGDGGGGADPAALATDDGPAGFGHRNGAGRARSAPMGRKAGLTVAPLGSRHGTARKKGSDHVRTVFPGACGRCRRCGRSARHLPKRH